MKALMMRFYGYSEEEFYNLSKRQVGDLVEQIKYTYEMSEDFGKPPRIKKGQGPTDADFLEAAERYNISLPPRVRFQLGDKNWQKEGQEYEKSDNA